MNCKRFSSLSWLICIAWLATARADGPGLHLVFKGSTNQLNPINKQFSRGLRWSHGGYFFMDEVGATAPTFYSLDRDGAWTATARFRNDEPVRFYTFDSDRESNGRIVFAGQTETAPRVVSAFLAWTSAGGETQQLIRTDPYFPYRVAIAPDDTIWTLGFEMVHLDPEDPAVNQEAHVLRHYDRAGNLIESAFPQSGFSRYQRFQIVDGQLVASRDRLGWYGRHGGKGAYNEIYLPTMTKTVYAGATSDSSRFELADGLVLTDSGVAAVSVVSHSPTARTNYVFDRTVMRWIPVSFLPGDGTPYASALIGRDGENLVFHSKNQAQFFGVSR